MDLEPQVRLSPTAEGSAAIAGDLAVQACQSCRRQKRKCDKSLPACGLCQRIGRSCDYSTDGSPNATAPSSEDFIALRQQVADLQELVRTSIVANEQTNRLCGSGYISNGSTTSEQSSGNGFIPGSWSIIEEHSISLPPANRADFPALYFLDSTIFVGPRYQIPTLSARLPQSALTVLGDSAELRAMIEGYFESVHTYFPVISKMRLYQYLANHVHAPGADMALLFIAMKLVSSEVPEHQEARTPLYQHAKTLYTYIESQNGFTVHGFQALLLICLYECGHAIYPAAYLSVGHATRLGYAEGLHDRDAPQMLPRSNTWTELEERRRIWWAVMILDRFINIGHRAKPLATTDPPLETYLPTDEDSWDRGEMLAAAPLALSASSKAPAAPFARVCQSAYLLGKVVRHVDDKKLQQEFRYDEALQLHRTVRALVDVLPEGRASEELSPPRAPCTSLALCYSSLSMLYDSYICGEGATNPGPEDMIVMQQTSIAGLRDVSERIVDLARHTRYFIQTVGVHGISPLIIDCIYAASANYAWYLHETSNPSYRDHVTELKEVLMMLNRRWRAAGAYLFILADFWESADWSSQTK